jgi:hypothetical protein
MKLIFLLHQLKYLSLMLFINAIIDTVFISIIVMIGCIKLFNTDDWHFQVIMQNLNSCLFQLIIIDFILKSKILLCNLIREENTNSIN